MARLHSLFLAALTLGTSAQAYELKHDSGGHPVRWRETLVITVDEATLARLGPGATSALDAALAQLQTACTTVTLRRETGRHLRISHEVDDEHPRVNAVVGLDDWPYDPKALAVTVVASDPTTHELVDADVALNLQHFRFGVLPPSGPPADHSLDGLDDVQNTLTHELGHVLGLEHNPLDQASVMFPGTSTGEVHKRTLTADDRKALGLLYDWPFDQGWGPGGAGCSAGTGGPVGLLLAMLLWLARRPRVLAPWPSPPRSTTSR
ncbi:MAG: matrixin family metalloprotease [Myxococcaceae bacterium]|nr:matrixin family metalloprotease [Myxococcaceae bacterium]